MNLISNIELTRAFITNYNLQTDTLPKNTQIK